MPDLFDLLIRTAKPRSPADSVPQCCWRAVAELVRVERLSIAVLSGGASGNLATRVSSGGRAWMVKGINLADASTRDHDRFDIEGTVLTARPAGSGVPILEGEVSCHWRLLVTRWIQGWVLCGTDSATALFSALSTIRGMADVVEGVRLPSLQRTLARPVVRSALVEGIASLPSNELVDAVSTYAEFARKPDHDAILHGGIWPDNLLVSLRDKLTVLDWGSAMRGPISWDIAHARLLAGQLSDGAAADPVFRSLVPNQQELLGATTTLAILIADRCVPTEARPELVTSLLRSVGEGGTVPSSVFPARHAGPMVWRNRHRE